MSKDKEKIGESEVCSEEVETSEGEESGDEVYEVEYIIDVKVANDGTCKYLVKWKNYSHLDNTWEPIENFCDRQCVDDFWEARRKLALKRIKEFDKKFNGKFDTTNFFKGTGGK
uniref:Chromo domain-containing protein n=1 Tax=Strongyloides papillosus TaxID=174720 RepID=A0A0N5CEN9_STREA